MYNFYLDGVQLPVAPPKLSMKVNNRNETLVLIDDGEINLLKKVGLTDFEFTVELPNVKYPYAVYPNGYQPAAHYLEKLEQLKVNQKPFQFIVNRLKPNGDLLFDTNMTVSLEDYTVDEDAENGFDIVSTIRLKQYRTWGTKTLVMKSNATTNTTTAIVEQQRDASSKTVAKTHTVVKGDTLWAICKRYYGKVSLTMTNELAQKNNIKNPDLIYPGQVIKL